MVAMLTVGLSATPISSAADALFTAVLLGAADGEEEAESAKDGIGKLEVKKLGGFARWFLEENRRRLSRAAELVGAWCVFHKIKYIPLCFRTFVRMSQC